MKILVTCKRVPNPEQKLKLSGGKVDLSGANWQVNTFDEYAVETALRLTEKGKGGERSIFKAARETARPARHRHPAHPRSPSFA